MKLTITISDGKKMTDYMLDDGIKIKTALELISKNDNLQLPNDLKYIYSRRKKEKISTNYSFKQAEIYNGDIIVLQ